MASEYECAERVRTAIAWQLVFGFHRPSTEPISQGPSAAEAGNRVLREGRNRVHLSDRGLARRATGLHRCRSTGKRQPYNTGGILKWSSVNPDHTSLTPNTPSPLVAQCRSASSKRV